MSCPFCLIIAGRKPAEIVHRTNLVIAIVPLNPVTPGHLLVIPTTHVEDFTSKPSVTAFVGHAAAKLAAELGGDFNLITSAGEAATQTVGHFHVHLIPRRAGDGLLLPWSVQQGIEVRRQYSVEWTEYPGTEDEYVITTSEYDTVDEARERLEPRTDDDGNTDPGRLIGRTIIATEWTVETGSQI